MFNFAKSIMDIILLKLNYRETSTFFYFLYLSIFVSSDFYEEPLQVRLCPYGCICICVRPIFSDQRFKGLKCLKRKNRLISLVMSSGKLGR